ncbi:MAG: hypothetical protein J6W56_08950 [Prevotella sp.]|nr:hypothetical protein [Prevotella sp.]
MDLLTIRHEDFTMYVECTKFEGIWNKATDMLSDAIPQKGLFYQEGEPLYLLISMIIMI